VDFGLQAIPATTSFEFFPVVMTKIAFSGIPGFLLRGTSDALYGASMPVYAGTIVNFAQFFGESVVKTPY